MTSHWAIFYVANTKKTQSEIEWHPNEKHAREIFARPTDTAMVTKYLCNVFAVEGRHPNETVALKLVAEVPISEENKDENVIV
jgi:hypothetical protein